MKVLTIIIFALITSDCFSQSLTNSFVFVEETEMLSDGLNPVTFDPLPGSDWTIKFSTANAGSCNAFVSDGHIYNDGLVYKTTVAFKAKTAPNCTGIALADDPYNLVSWLDQGIVQESFFSDEILSCGVGTSCEANQNITYENKSFVTINPTAGGNATSSGKTDLFLYNYKTLSSTNANGSFGVGGKANLPKNPISIKYCVYLRDVTTDNRTSSYAKNPEISIKVINWKPIAEGPNASNGTGIGSIQKSTVIKGLDSSTRYWIGRGSVLGE